MPHHVVADSEAAGDLGDGQAGDMEAGDLVAVYWRKSSRLNRSAGHRPGRPVVS